MTADNQSTPTTHAPTASRHRRCTPRRVLGALLTAAVLATTAPACTAQARPPRPIHIAGISVQRSQTPAARSPSGAACTDYTLTVHLAATGHHGWHVWGRLCTRGPSYGGHPLELLVHGATYDHRYWDWPNAARNYVRAATAAGFTTLDIDCLGTGLSDHPSGNLLTPDVEAGVLHTLVTALRRGAFGVLFPRIVLVGHSLGAIIAWDEAGRWNDIDALILSDATHHLAPATLAKLTADKIPATDDPLLAHQPWASTYLTTKPGARCNDFYNQQQPGARLTCAMDERTKSTVPDAALPAVPAALDNPAPEDHITAPILDALGGDDTLFPPAAAAHEARAFPHARSFRRVIIKGSGHVLNLQGPSWFGVADAWARQALDNLDSQSQ
jgi:pimeloyl-ACP methyl ester carboxylesterase